MNIFEIFAQLPQLVAMLTAGTSLLTTTVRALAENGGGDGHDGMGDASTEQRERDRGIAGRGGVPLLRQLGADRPEFSMENGATVR